ncbi:MAG: hypothetical protein ABI347_08455 [Nitrososphaera sp.]
MGAPIFALPVIGDIADVVISGLLFSITKSKKAAAINAIEFIPVIGDFIPAYTISTVMWIFKESSRRRKQYAQAGKNDLDFDGPPSAATTTMAFCSKEQAKMKKIAMSRYGKWKRGKQAVPN